MGKIKLAKVNYEKASEEIGNFITEHVLAIPNFTGGVIGLSGGVDSTLTAILAKRAFDKNNLINERKISLTGYILPSLVNSFNDTEDGKFVAERLGIKHELINIQPVVDAYKITNPETFKSNYNRGNLMSEIRAVILHQKAAMEKKLVLGTGNRDEDFCVGYYTLFGDGAVHLSPIGNLPKRLVKEMVKYFGFEKLANKTPTAGLEPGQTDFRDLGYRYETAEVVINGIEQGLNLEEILKDDLFKDLSNEDLKNYFAIYQKHKFLGSQKIIENIISRNTIARAKSKIVHPPSADISLYYE